LRLSVSSGTYIRAIANDIGEKIGCGASVVELKRIRIGNFDIRDSLCLEDLVLIFKNMQTERNFLDDKNYINYIKSLIPIEKLLEDKKIIYIKEKYVKILETNSPLYPEMIDEKSIKTNKINLFKAGEIIILKANGEKKLYYHRVLSDFDLNELRKERQKLTKYLPLD
jgi:tRNA pseudouridine55 synthase